ncbi:MAG: S8 family serine peptidase [Lysobacterales bacterium]
MALRKKPLVVALSLLLSAQGDGIARPAGLSISSRPSASPTPEQVAAARDNRLLVLQAGIFDPVSEQLVSERFGLSAVANSRYAVVQFAEGRRLSAAQLRALGAEVLDYVPHNAYLVRLHNPADAGLRQHPDVRFVGPWQPAWKIAPDLQNVGAVGSLIVDVYGFRGEDQAKFLARLAASVGSAELAGGEPQGKLPHAWFRVAAASLDAFLGEAAMIEEVSWMARFELPHLHNRDSIGPIQSNQATTATGPTPDQASIWTKGLTGAGQIVGVADSGLDRNQEFFINLNKGSGVVTAVTDAVNVSPPALGTTHPNNKVFGYFVMPGASPYDDNQDCGGGPTSFHGTHTSGTVAGDAGVTATPSSGGWTAGDGMAPNAQLLFQDIGNDSTGCLSGVGGQPMWEQSRAAGAFVHSNSYGSNFSGAYSGGDLDVDQATWDNQDLLIVFSAGNDGPGASTIGHPGHAKNVLTVGALQHGNSPTVVSFSSRGPASDGRRKPDIQAPGTSIISASGNDEDASANGGAATKPLSGTSMSAPTVAGGAALMRQYFVDGYYPSGVKTAADARNPLGAELKATLMNGTSFVSSTPDNIYGWGRIWLDNNLYFAGGATDLRDLRNFAVSGDTGIQTGQTHSYQVQVDAGQEFRATLAWYDPPPALGTGAALVNNLDLEVQQGATIYKGNVITGSGATAVSVTGGSADILNPVEQVRFTAPVAGLYTLRVKGSAVPGNGDRYSDQQGYALAVSSAQCASAVSTPASALVLTTGGTGVTLSPTHASASTFQAYRAEGSCASANAGDFQLIGPAASGSLLDTTAQGGIGYAYKVRFVDGCGEGPLSVCQDIVSAAQCTLLPEFNPQSLVPTSAPSAGSCGVDLSWTAAASACPAASNVVYNVYRSTDPFFTPGAANRIATGISGTSFHDALVDSLTTYYYAVKAEDNTTGNNGPNGGNETPEVFRRKVTPAAATTVPGTFSDGADSPSFMLQDNVWSISNDRAATGVLSYRSALDGAGTYTADTCATIQTPPITLQAGSPALSFKARYDIELQWDGVVMEISNNGGGTWTDLPPDGGYPNTLSQTQGNGCGYPPSQGAFTGSSGGVFVNRSRNLSAFAGQTVQIRWRFTSDSGAEEEGFYLDDVQVSNASTPGSCQGVTLFSNGFE